MRWPDFLDACEWVDQYNSRLDVPVVGTPVSGYQETDPNASA